MEGRAHILPDVAFKWFTVPAFSAQHLADWCQLGVQACTPNFYLSPAFVLPAQTHLTPELELQVGTLWCSTGKLLALGLFHPRPASWRYPFSRRIAYHCKHSFQSGLLVHTDCGPDQLKVFLQNVLANQGGLQIDDLRTDTELFTRLQAATTDLPCQWLTTRQYERAILKEPATAFTQLPRKRHKENARKLRRLREHGTVTFSVTRSRELQPEQLQSFLDNERTGNRAETALVASAGEEEFFQALMENARQHGLVFNYELCLDGRIIASTINFTLAGQGFAFKTAYDSKFAQFSPGTLVEYEFLRWCLEHQPNLTEFESGAQPGSYIERLWRDKALVAHLSLIREGLPIQIFRLKQLGKQITARVLNNSSQA
ncbi:MAG: GNAT family N-acetyltransferase [Pseudomonadota bacterium]